MSKSIQPFCESLTCRTNCPSWWLDFDCTCRLSVNIISRPLILIYCTWAPVEDKPLSDISLRHNPACLFELYVLFWSCVDEHSDINTVSTIGQLVFDNQGICSRTINCWLIELPPAIMHPPFQNAWKLAPLSDWFPSRETCVRVHVSFSGINLPTFRKIHHSIDCKICILGTSG